MDVLTIIKMINLQPIFLNTNLHLVSQRRDGLEYSTVCDTERYACASIVCIKIWGAFFYFLNPSGSLA